MALGASPRPGPRPTGPPRKPSDARAAAFPVRTAFIGIFTRRDAYIVKAGGRRR